VVRPLSLNWGIFITVFGQWSSALHARKFGALSIETAAMGAENRKLNCAPGKSAEEPDASRGKTKEWTH